MSYKILQLTDTHLFETPGQKMFGVDTNQRFSQTLAFIQQNKLEFDAIFLTGDVSQDESTASYEMVAKALSTLNKKIYWIAGNHDDFSKMHAVFSQYPLFENTHHFCEQKTGWHFVFTDSVLKGKDSGYLDFPALQLLTSDLKSIPDTAPIAVILHHHPIPVGTPLTDKYIVENGEVLYDIITASQRNVKVVICGHVHGDYDIVYENIRLISSPATCLQWKKGTDKLDKNDVSGFMLWSFSHGGEFNYETFFVNNV